MHHERDGSRLASTERSAHFVNLELYQGPREGETAAAAIARRLGAVARRGSGMGSPRTLSRDSLNLLEVLEHSPHADDRIFIENLAAEQTVSGVIHVLASSALDVCTRAGVAPRDIPSMYRSCATKLYAED